MSPIAATTPASTKGIKGKRVIGKPGRFDPDRPFHMSTRKGGNKTSSASAPSANGSAEAFESRRASLDAERPVTANSNGTQASKETYASDFSPPRPVPDIDMTEAPLEVPTVGLDDDERKSRSPTPAKQATPSRKRKRSSPSPPPAPLSDDDYLETGGDDNLAPPEDDYDSDTVQVIRQDDLSDREKSVNGDANADEEADESPNSTPSQEPSLVYNPLTGKWADASPIISEQPSPATSGSGDEENQYEDTAITKPLTAALKEVRAEQVEPVTIEQAEDEPMVDAAPGIDDADEIEEQVRTDEDGRMMVRRGRFGGRRRAQHPNIDIEVAMRRQAQLKSAYRTLARAQKNVLIELATRTIDELESNPNVHTQVTEYESIMRGLDAALADRKATIQAQHDMKLKQLRVTRDGEQDAIVDKCRQQLEDMEEAKVDQLQYEFLRIARTAQLENEDETEDEDDFIPRPKHTAYHWKRGAGLGKEFDSRSRLAIETRQAAEDMQARYNMHEILKELPKVDKPQKRDAFAVMDKRPRTAASKNREGQDNLDILVAAGNEAERRAGAVIPNEQAVGLQMLADLSVRPSILGTRPQSSDSASVPGIGRNPPPGLHLQVPPGHSPIQLQMSPRTQHAMGNRFDSSHMPPPSTPRQDANAPGGRSPSFRKHERRPSSPNKQEQRPNGLQGHGFNEPMRSPAQQPRLNQAEMLQQRIASRDGALQDSLFGSSARNTRPFPDFPGWRPIDASEGPRRRAASHSDLAPLFGVRPDPPLEHRREEPGRETERPTVRAELKNESPKFDPVHAQGLRWPDQFHSQAGAPKGRKDETASPKSEQLSMIGTPGHKYSSSSGQDSAAGNKTSLQNSRNSNFGKFSHKTNKAERNGASRRQKHKDKKKQNQQQEDGRSESTSTPGTAPAQYAGSPASDFRAQSPWFSGPPPIHSPRDYHPPSNFPHHHSGSYGGPPPPHNLPAHHPPGAPMHHHRSSYDYGFHHRNSFPPAPPPPWQGSGGPPPPSSLYALPHQQQQHPPPPGVPPEQYNRPFAPPPPPPGFQGGPQTPHPHSAGPGSGFPNATNNNHQNNCNFRGPAIAPAGGFNPGGFRPANPPLPAFAQQQQQNGGTGSGSGGGSRRRTQSDASFAKFLPLWKPKDGG